MLLEVDLSQDHNDLFESIKERVSFPEITKILPIADVYFLVEAERLEASGINEETYPPYAEHLKKEFSLHFTPISIEEDHMVTNIKFSVQTDEKTPNKKKLLDNTFRVPFSRTLLIGFPTNDETGRGTVYWLAFTIEH